MSRINHVTIRVKKENNYGYAPYPVVGTKIAGEIDSFMGGITRGVRTDEYGEAELEWYGNHDLKAIFVKGGTYEGCWEDGDHDTIVIPRR